MRTLVFLDLANKELLSSRNTEKEREMGMNKERGKLFQGKN